MNKVESRDPKTCNVRAARKSSLNSPENNKWTVVDAAAFS